MTISIMLPPLTSLRSRLPSVRKFFGSHPNMQVTRHDGNSRLRRVLEPSALAPAAMKHPTIRPLNACDLYPLTRQLGPWTQPTPTAATRAATSDAPHASRHFPEKRAAPPRDKAQQDYSLGNRSTKISVSRSPPSPPAAQEDMAFFIPSNYACFRHIFGDVCTRRSVSQCCCNRDQHSL